MVHLNHHPPVLSMNEEKINFRNLLANGCLQNISPQEKTTTKIQKHDHKIKNQIKLYVCIVIPTKRGLATTY
jgi:hypothetical protein